MTKGTTLWNGDAFVILTLVGVVAGCEAASNPEEPASWRVRTPARVIAFELHPTRVLGDTVEPTVAAESERGTAGLLHAVSGVAEAGDTAYVLDASYQKLVAFDPEGRPRVLVEGFGNGPGEFANPTDLSLGPDNRLYVLDRGNGRISIFNTDGTHHNDFPVRQPILSIATTQEEVYASRIIRSGRWAVNKYSLSGELVDSLVEIQPRWRAAAETGASGALATSSGGSPFYLAPISGTIAELRVTADLVEYPDLSSVKVGEGRSALDFFPLGVKSGRRYSDGRLMLIYHDAIPEALAAGTVDVRLFVDVFEGDAYAGSAVLEAEDAALKYAWPTRDELGLWVQLNDPHPRLLRYELR